MNNNKHSLLWSLILVLTGSLVNPAQVLADSDDHHQREFGESVPPAVHKAWMRWIPDNVSLFAISIPATHDSITYTAPSGGACETQLMDVVQQMNAGIRAFDIRASRQKNPDRLELWHGSCKLYRTLDDVLKHMVAFLQANPTETLILRLGDDGIGDGDSDHDTTAKSMQELFELHRCRYKDSFWFPDDSSSADGDPCDAEATWKSRGLTGNTTATITKDSINRNVLSPTLGEVRGKIVLLRESGWPSVVTPYAEYLQLGLHIDQSDRFSRWNLNALCDDWEDTAYGAGNHLVVANSAGGWLDRDPTAARGALTIAQLDAVSALCYPYSSSEWIDREFYRFLVGYSDMQNDADQTLGSFTGKSTGLVSMDFPGPGLIDAVIAHNLRLAVSPSAVGREFDTLFENTWYAIEEDRPDDGDGDDDARDRWEAFRTFLTRMLPGYSWQLSVMRLDGHLTGRATTVKAYPSFAGELKDGEWHVFFYTNTQPPPTNPSKSALQSFVDNHPPTASSATYRAAYLRDRLKSKWPDVDWTVVTYLEPPFGFENLTVGGNAGVFALSKSINNTRYYVSGIRKPPPPMPVADAGGPYVGDEGPGGIVLYPGAATSSGGTSTLQWRWDIDGDGSWDTERSNSSSIPFKKLDDYQGIVRLEAWNGLATHVDQSTITIRNVAPTLYPTSGSSLVFEGAQATINGFISDPGTDSMTVRIDWNGDGSNDTTTNLPFENDKCAFSPSEYCTTFSATYVYPDNGPPPNGEIAARVTVEDDNGGSDTHYHTVYVQNNPPSAGSPTLIRLDTGLAIAANEQIPPGTQVQVSVTWSDVPADFHSARIEWGDGAITPYPAVNSSPLTGTHTYTTDGARQILVVIKDDDNGFTYRPTVPFRVGTPPPPPPQAPTANGGGPYTAPEGSPVILDGSASTVDASLTAQYRWDFNGDGVWDTERSTNPLSPPWLGPDPLHPNDFATTSARLEVFDGITAVVDSSIGITITNVAPTVKATATEANEGDLTLITVEVTDPGWDWHDVALDVNDDDIWDRAIVTLVPGEQVTVFRYVFEDEPYGMPHYPVKVWAFDRKAGGVLAVVPTIVHNVPPTASIDSVVAADADRVPSIPPDTQDYFVVNADVTLNGHWSDPGRFDLQTVSIDWGDGSSTVLNGLMDPNTQIQETHQYATVGDHTIILQVTDIDGGVSPEVSWSITVVDRPDPPEIIHADGFETGFP